MPFVWHIPPCYEESETYSAAAGCSEKSMTFFLLASMRSYSSREPTMMRSHWRKPVPAGHGIANLNKTEVAALQRGVLVAQTTGGDNLTLLQVLGVTCIGDHLLAPDAVVLLGKVELVDKCILEERGVAGIVDLHLAHHLTNDDLEVLVVDLHTLQTIDVLHLVTPSESFVPARTASCS